MVSRNFSKVKIPVPVVVRSFDGRPVRLIATRLEGSYVVVTKGDSVLAVGFPLAFVYCDDPGTFSEILEHYEAGKTDQLLDLWGRARRFDPQLLRPAVPLCAVSQSQSSGPTGPVA